MKLVVAILAFACASCTEAAVGPPPPVVWSATPPATEVAASEPAEVPEPVRDPAADLDDHHRRIFDNVLSVMNDPRWSHLRGLPVADYEDVARDIARAVDLGDDATLLASLAYLETGFAAFVDDHRCNDPEWRASPEGRAIMGGKSCDGGIAISVFQVHPITDKTSPLYELCSREAIWPRVGAARCALRIARASMESTGTLQNYTGESDEYHAKADRRLQVARDAVARHPFRD